MDVSISFESAILKLGKRKISEEMRNGVTIATGQFNNNNTWRKRVAMKEKSVFLQPVHSVREGGTLKVFHGIGKRRGVFFLMTVGRTGVALEAVPPYWEGEWNVLMIDVLREIVVMSLTTDLSFRLQCFVLSFFYFEFVCCLFKMRLGLMILKK